MHKLSSHANAQVGGAIAQRNHIIGIECRPMQSHVLCGSESMTICKRSSNAIRVWLRMQICPQPLHSWHFFSTCYSKNGVCGRVCWNGSTSSCLAAKEGSPFCFDAPPLPRLHLVAPSYFTLTSRASNVLHHQLFICVVSKVVIKNWYNVANS